jgi:hypothetical protein
MYFFEGMRVYVNYHEEDPITYLYIDKESLVLVTEAPDIEKSSSTSRFVFLPSPQRERTSFLIAILHIQW